MQQSIAKLFGIQAPPSAMIEVRDEDHALIPKKDDNYIFRKEILSDVLAWLRGAAGIDPLFLSGHTGTGKTSVANQIMAAVRVPLYPVSCHERMEAPEFMGRYVVRNGSMEWMDGPLVAGLKDPAGAIILLDELDTVDPGTAVALHPALEGKSFIIPETGELIDPTRYGARIIAAGNTAGSGDESGLYQSTKRQNAATMGRFMIVTVGYPTVEEETSVLLRACPDVGLHVIECMIKVANEVRMQYINGDIELVFCTRSLIRWANLSQFFRSKPGISPLHYALDRAIGFRAEEASRSGLHELVQRICG